MLTDGQIVFYKGKKYQLVSDWWVETPIINQAARWFAPDTDAGVLPKIELTTLGKLIIRAGYAWDGPSGPTWDTSDFMRGSLAHDALYQLMRTGALAQSARKAADQLLFDLCRQDGMNWVRAKYVLFAVRAFAKDYAKRQREAMGRAP